MTALIGNNFESYGLRHEFKGMIILSLLIHLAFFSILFFIPGFKKMAISSHPIISIDIVSLHRNEPATGSSAGLQEIKPEKPIPEKEIEVKQPEPEKKMTYNKDKKVEQKSKTKKKTVIASGKKVYEEMEKAIEKIRHGLLAKGKGGTAEGGKEGSGIGYSKQGGVPQGTMDLKFQIYYSVIWSKIKDAWVLPENMTSAEKNLEAIIAIRIRKDGEIVKVWTEKSSENDYFDQSALRAIAKANPLPPVPEGYSEDYFELGIRFFPSGP